MSIVRAEARRLPPSDTVFDAVIIESVLDFSDAASVIAEIRSVQMSNGVIGVDELAFLESPRASLVSCSVAQWAFSRFHYALKRRGEIMKTYLALAFVLAICVWCAACSPLTPLGAQTHQTAESPGGCPDILGRARTWIDSRVPYGSFGKDPTIAYHDGYRADCSGFVSFAWQLPKPGVDSTSFESSGDAIEVPMAELRPGDAINNERPLEQGHVVLFVEWLDKASGRFKAYDLNTSPGYADEKNLTLENTSAGWTIKELEEFARGPYHAQRLKSLTNGASVCNAAEILAPQGAVPRAMAPTVVAATMESEPDIPKPTGSSPMSRDPCGTYAFTTSLAYDDVVAFYQSELPRAGWTIVHFEQHMDASPGLNESDLYLARGGEKAFVSISPLDPGGLVFVTGNPHDWYNSYCAVAPEDVPLRGQLIGEILDACVNDAAGNPAMHSIQYRTRESPLSVVEFYRSQMPINGWQPNLDQALGGESYELCFVKPGRKEPWQGGPLTPIDHACINVNPDTFQSVGPAWGKASVIISLSP